MLSYFFETLKGKTIQVICCSVHVCAQACLIYSWTRDLDLTFPEGDWDNADLLFIQYKYFWKWTIRINALKVRSVLTEKVMTILRV